MLKNVQTFEFKKNNNKIKFKEHPCGALVESLQGQKEFQITTIFMSVHIFEEPYFNYNLIIHGDPFDCQQVFINYHSS